MAANAQLQNAPAAPESRPQLVVDAEKPDDSPTIDPVAEEPKWFEAARALRLKRQGSVNSDRPTVSVAHPQSQGAPPSDAPPDPKQSQEPQTKPSEILSPKIGVAFSGGGVRSATFNLGVLQALASHGVLDKVGYISSVSGGSYINAWLASWISKCGFDGVNKALADHDLESIKNIQSTEQPKTETSNAAEVQNAHAESNHTKAQSSAEERYNRQRPISHLRHYSSYLTPHSGLLSSDVWAAVAAYGLRLAPNLLFVMLGAFTLICIPYLMVGAYRFNAYPSVISKIVFYILGLLGHTAKNAHSTSFQQEINDSKYTLNSYAALAWATFLCFLGFARLYLAKDLDRYDPDKATESRRTASSHATVAFSTMLLIGPLVAMAGVYASTVHDKYEHPLTELFFYVPELMVLLGLFVLAFISAFLFSRAIGIIPLKQKKKHIPTIHDKLTTEGHVTENEGDSHSTSSKPPRQNALLPTAAIGGIFFALVAFAFALCFHLNDQDVASAIATVLAPSFLLLAYVGMASVGVALLPYDSGSQEWLNRIWGDCAILTLGWTAVASITLLWPQLVGYVIHVLKEQRPVLVWSGLSLASGWVLTTISGILSAFSSKTSGPPTVDSVPTPWRIRTKQGGSQHWVENLLARIAPYVFVIGLLLLVSSLVQLIKVPLIEWLFVSLGIVFTVLLGQKIDVNRLSLHKFYRFRLIECYLAASRRSDAESLALAELSPNLASASLEPAQPAATTLDPLPFDGPLSIINWTLNVTKGDSLDLQKRRARNFIFSPVACGFTRFKNEDVAGASLEKRDKSAVTSPETLEKKATISTPRKPLREYAMISSKDCASVLATPLSLASTTKVRQPQSITLGAAMAISGAAQSPNQGSHTSPAVAALLTLANIRLGWWLGNPRDEATYKQEGPDNGLRPMLDELLAQATDEKGYIYLSDGGHFENLGLYELIRRRCKLIVLCDADCDPAYKFDDLVNAIELCQVDFGATITLDTDPLQNTLKAGWCRTAFTVGTIKYSNVDGDSDTGTIVYLKSAVTRQNSIVVHRYDRYSKHFPHEPTTNQWFDEAQFEAYRLLGLETANAALDAITPQFPLETRKDSSNGTGKPGNGSSNGPSDLFFPPPPWWSKPQQAWRERAEQAQSLLWSKAELKGYSKSGRGSPNSNNGGQNAKPNHSR
jgi:hypothetical protein